MSLFAMFHRAVKRHEFELDHGPAPGVICILVHGTFAPGSLWTRDGSSFRTDIAVALARYSPVRFATFTWRGKNHNAFNNTHSDRSLAAEALSQSIRQLATDYPRSPLFVLGHSHGGTVILHAVACLADRKAVRGIVTLATPFLVWRPDTLWLRVIANFGLLVTFCVAYALLSWLSFQLLEYINWTSTTAFYVAGIGAFAIALVAFSGVKWWDRRVTRIHARFRGLIHRLQMEHRRIGAPAVTEVPKYVAYVQIGEIKLDEASGWLAIGDLITGMPRWVIENSAVIIGGIPLLGTFILLAVVVTLLVNWPLLFLGSMFVAIFVFPALVRSLQLFFGGESILMNALGKVAIDNVPPSLGQNPNDVSRGYRPQLFFTHGLYNSKDVIEDISAWIVHRCDTYPESEVS